MAQKKSKSGGNRKHGSNADYCKLYTAAGLHEKNGKRRLRRHLIAYPDDTQAVTAYEKTFGRVADIRVVMNGVSTSAIFGNRARRKMARKLDTGLAIHLRAQRDARRHARRVAAEKETEQTKRQKHQPVVTTV